VTPQYTGIYVVRPDGSALRRVTAPTEIAGTPQWSPDGSRLGFDVGDVDQVCRGGLIFGTGTTQIASVTIATGARETLTSGRA
jgi:Tol biopolymer transport system component